MLAEGYRKYWRTGEGKLRKLVALLMPSVISIYAVSLMHCQESEPCSAECQ